MATYLIINCLVLLGMVPGIVTLRKRPHHTWWLALASLLVLTIVFDNIIIGLGIVGYHHAHILGIFIGNVPLEDMFYALGAMIIVPALWQQGSHHE